MSFIKLEPLKPLFGTWKEDGGNGYSYPQVITPAPYLGKLEKFAKNFYRETFGTSLLRAVFSWRHHYLTLRPRRKIPGSWFAPAGPALAKDICFWHDELQTTAMAAYRILQRWLVRDSGLFGNKILNTSCVREKERSPSVLQRYLRKCWFVDCEKLQSIRIHRLFAKKSPDLRVCLDNECGDLCVATCNHKCSNTKQSHFQTRIICN